MARIVNDTELVLDDGETMTPEQYREWEKRYKVQCIIDTVMANRWIFGSWGVPRSSILGGYDDGPMLQFDVEGMKFQGRVRIRLQSDDLYTVEFWRKTRVDGVLMPTLAKKMTDVDWEHLVSRIDGFVER